MFSWGVFDLSSQDMAVHRTLWSVNRCARGRGEGNEAAVPVVPILQSCGPCSITCRAGVTTLGRVGLPRGFVGMGQGRALPRPSLNHPHPVSALHAGLGKWAQEGDSSREASLGPSPVAPRLVACRCSYSLFLSSLQP